MVVGNGNPSNHATLQSFIVAIYVSALPLFIGMPTSCSTQEIGCLIGALSNLWVGDWLGRRKTIVLGGIIMIIGAILQASSYSYAQMVVARIVTGLGNGLNVGVLGTLSVPVLLKNLTVHRRQLCHRTMQSARLPHDEAA